MDVKKHAEEYFSSINPIASRLYSEINQTKAAYENLWNTLTPDEQDQIINESIIKPEILIKYQHPKSGQCVENTEYSSKMIIDENNCAYRDEHSAPFSFKTKSQRDLRLFSSCKESNAKKGGKNRNLMKKMDNPVADNLDQEDIKIKLTSSTGSLPKTGLDFLDNW